MTTRRFSRDFRTPSAPDEKYRESRAFLAAKGRLMRIRRLKLSGFKSFVEATELRVEPGLTGIVGPNGCGKSNLLEAIRWVMGGAAAKSLGGRCMEDVIFAGTRARPARDFAEVSIVLAQLGLDGEGGRDAEIVRRIERG